MKSQLKNLKVVKCGLLRTALFMVSLCYGSVSYGDDRPRKYQANVSFCVLLSTGAAVDRTFVVYKRVASKSVTDSDKFLPTRDYITVKASEEPYLACSERSHRYLYDSSNSTKSTNHELGYISANITETTAEQEKSRTFYIIGDDGKIKLTDPRHTTKAFAYGMGIVANATSPVAGDTTVSSAGCVESSRGNMDCGKVYITYHADDAQVD